MKYVLLASRYVKAFSNCFDSDSDKISQLSILADVITKVYLEKGVVDMINDPTVISSKKFSVLSLYIPSGNKMLSNFLSLLIQKDRFFLLDDMATIVESMIYDLKKEVPATVYSSVSLQPKDKQTILAYLKSYFKKDVDLKMIVDESILAGVKVEANNTVFDATLDNSLKNLKLAFQ
tara:strand:+ start:210 stop:740 length:531 start_codon:yes stop_codon:yes gene_type:complete